MQGVDEQDGCIGSVDVKSSASTTVQIHTVESGKRTADGTSAVVVISDTVVFARSGEKKASVTQPDAFV